LEVIGVLFLKISVLWDVMLFHWVSSLHHLNDHTALNFRVNQLASWIAWP